MARPMRILMIGDFRGGAARAIWNNPRKLYKGFICNGHDVMDFSYADILEGMSPFKSKKWMLRFYKGRTDEMLAQTGRNYQPDMVVTSFKYVDGDTIRRLREACPKAIYVCRYGDLCVGTDERVLDVAKECDLMVATSGGEVLRRYKEAGVKCCAFIPNYCNPAVEYWREVGEGWQSDVMFTGKISHSLRGQDPMRAELVKRLTQTKDMKTWGCLGKPPIEGIDYLQAICGAKIALSINAFNEVKYYHSDRLTHLLACGAFVLAKRVPGSELMFEDGRHIVYFDTVEQCEHLIDYYLGHDVSRRKIARAGMEHIHAEFNCVKLAGYIIDLVTKGNYAARWADIV